jgi:hypothetical protein
MEGISPKGKGEKEKGKRPEFPSHTFFGDSAAFLPFPFNF